MKITFNYSFDVDDIIFALQIANSVEADLKVSDVSLQRAISILDDFSYHLDSASSVCHSESLSRHDLSSCSIDK